MQKKESRDAGEISKKNAIKKESKMQKKESKSLEPNASEHPGLCSKCVEKIPDD